jgi:hypothetical protein
LVFRLGKRLPMKTFFTLSSVLLILIASGIAAYAVHEILEYGALRSPPPPRNRGSQGLAALPTSLSAFRGVSLALCLLRGVVLPSPSPQRLYWFGAPYAYWLASQHELGRDYHLGSDLYSWPLVVAPK